MFLFCVVAGFASTSGRKHHDSQKFLHLTNPDTNELIEVLNTQRKEFEWYLRFSEGHVLQPPLPEAKEDNFDLSVLQPGDILSHKDYGDSGHKLYDQLTGLAYAVHCVQNCIVRNIYRKTGSSDDYLSPFDLHPYIYLGVVECPEDNDAGPSGVVVPCVAQSSRFYPINDLFAKDGAAGGHAIDPTVNGVRRKKFSSIATESLFVWRVENEIARLRVWSYALAITNPWVVKFARPVGLGTHPPPKDCIDYPGPWDGPDGECSKLENLDSCGNTENNGYTAYDACCRCYHQARGWGGTRARRALIPYPAGNDKIAQLVLDAVQNDDWIDLSDKVEGNMFFKAHVAVQVMAMLGLEAESLGVALLDKQNAGLAKLILTAATTLHLATELGNDRKKLLKASKWIYKGHRNLGLTCGEFGTSLFMAIFTGKKDSSPISPAVIPEDPGSSANNANTPARNANLPAGNTPVEDTSERLEKAALSLHAQMAMIGYEQHSANPLEYIQKLPHWVKSKKKKSGKRMEPNMWDPWKPRGEDWLAWPGERGKRIPKWFTAVPPQFARHLHFDSPLGPPKSPNDFSPYVLHTAYLEKNLKEKAKKHLREQAEKGFERCTCQLISQSDVQGFFSKLYVKGMDGLEVAEAYVSKHKKSFKTAKPGGGDSAAQTHMEEEEEEEGGDPGQPEDGSWIQSLRQKSSAIYDQLRGKTSHDSLKPKQERSSHSLKASGGGDDGGIQ